MVKDTYTSWTTGEATSDLPDDHPLRLYRQHLIDGNTDDFDLTQALIDYGEDPADFRGPYE